MPQTAVTPVAAERKRQMNRTQLEKLGVRLLNRFDLALECATCGEVWTPNALPGGDLPPGYWKCPNRCNW